MKLIEMVMITVAVSLLFSVLGNVVFQLRTLDEAIRKARSSYYSTVFISESFRMTCAGKGFATVEEWGQTCGALWQLEGIGCETVEQTGEAAGGTESRESQLLCGSWSGPWGSGTVYCRIREK